MSWVPLRHRVALDWANQYGLLYYLRLAWLDVRLSLSLGKTFWHASCCIFLHVPLVFRGVSEGC